MSNMPQPVPTEIPHEHSSSFTGNANGKANPAAEQQPTSPPPEEGYPEQKHAGRVGYGPEYSKSVGVGTQFQGLYEEAKAKVTRNPETAEHGRLLRTGELARREREEDQAENPFGGGQSDPAAQQASTTAPAGTEEAERQREGHGSESVKHIG